MPEQALHDLVAANAVRDLFVDDRIKEQRKVDAQHLPQLQIGVLDKQWLQVRIHVCLKGRTWDRCNAGQSVKTSGETCNMYLVSCLLPCRMYFLFLGVVVLCT